MSFTSGPFHPQVFEIHLPLAHYQSPSFNHYLTGLAVSVVILLTRSPRREKQSCEEAQWLSLFKASYPFTTIEMVAYWPTVICFSLSFENSFFFFFGHLRRRKRAREMRPSAESVGHMVAVDGTDSQFTRGFFWMLCR